MAAEGEPTQTERVLGRLSILRDEADSYPVRRARVVAEAREVGLTWREIADALGMTQHGLIKAQNKHHG